ncbi:hypothetical protein V1478_005979 [Vespula squamosa]|uniref:Uncharacterized protein n=1 Tax=Vespula squamosa TaxID=30214 RepID=A0ABD2B910_VESSQ
MNDRHCREIGGIKSVPRIAILLRPEFYPVEDFYRSFDRIYYSYDKVYWIPNLRIEVRLKVVAKKSMGTTIEVSKSSSRALNLKIPSSKWSPAIVYPSNPTSGSSSLKFTLSFYEAETMQESSEVKAVVPLPC